MNNKKFLSDDPIETGSICWAVESDTSGDRFTQAVEANIKFYDCSRSVVLDFDCYKDSEVADRIKKADILIEELNKFREALVLQLPKPKKFHY
jgi:hypothetical protein